MPNQEPARFGQVKTVHAPSAPLALALAKVAKTALANMDFNNLPYFEAPQKAGVFDQRTPRAMFDLAVEASIDADDEIVTQGSATCLGINAWIVEYLRSFGIEAYMTVTTMPSGLHAVGMVHSQDPSNPDDRAFHIFETSLGISVSITVKPDEPGTWVESSCGGPLIRMV